MKPNTVAIVGAAETTELGEIPNTSQLELHCDAALNALADAGLKPSDIDGVSIEGLVILLPFIEFGVELGGE